MLFGNDGGVRITGFSARSDIEQVVRKLNSFAAWQSVAKSIYEELVRDDERGVVAVESEGRWSLLDRSGAPLTGEYYEWIGECSEGLFLAQRGGRCGFLDTRGREVIPFIYDDATSFAEGCAYVSQGGENYFIGGSGNRLSIHGVGEIEIKFA
jgi:hypothetical protein